MRGSVGPLFSVPSENASPAVEVQSREADTGWSFEIDATDMDEPKKERNKTCQ